MFRTGQKYKIEIKKGIFYTGLIVEESDTLISIKTDRGEEVVLNKNHILQSILLEQNRTGDDDGQRR